MSGKKGCFFGLMIIIGATLFYEGVEFMRGEYADPTHVYGVHFDESGGKNLAYLRHSVLILDDEDLPESREDAHRIDVIDLKSGERKARIGLGAMPSRWLGAKGGVAWLVSSDPELGLHARDMNSGEILATQNDLITKNASFLKGALNALHFDTRSGGVLARTSGGDYLINPQTFMAQPSAADAIVPPSNSNGDTTIAAIPAATLDDGSALQIAKGTWQIMRQGTAGGGASEGKFILGGFLHDVANNRPIRPTQPGSVIVRHFENDRMDADFILTALSPDGKKIWQVTEEDLDSGEEIRGAHQSKNGLMLVTDEDILFLDPASGKVTRRIEL